MNNQELDILPRDAIAKRGWWCCMLSARLCTSSVLSKGWISDIIIKPF